MLNARRRVNVNVNTGSSTGDALVATFIICLFVSLPAAWVTHVIWIIRKLASDAGATAGQMVLGAVGAFMPPVGIVHGYMVWFGVSF